MGLFEHFPYVNFHNLNLDWILTKIKDLLARMTAAEETLEDHEDRITTLESTVEDLDDRLETVEGKVDDLEGRMDAAESDIDTLQGFVPTEGSAGQVLTYVNSTTASWQDVPEELPAYSAANAGDILQVNSSGQLVWSDDLSSILNPKYITDESWISFSVPTGGVIRSTWARVNADKSVDFKISCGWQTSSSPWKETITATIDWSVIGGTFKPLEQWWVLYATDLGLGADPGVIGRAHQNTSGVITFELSDDYEIDFTGRFYLN